MSHTDLSILLDVSHFCLQEEGEKARMHMHDIVQQAQEAQVRLVRFQYCDNGGLLRSKAAHISRLAERLREGIGFTLAMQAWSGVETLAEVPGMGSVGEFRLVPDPATFVLLPYVPHSAGMLGDMRQLDGRPWEACPRSFLKRMLMRLAEQGMRAEAATEHEFYLARRLGSAYHAPADQSRLFSPAGLDAQAEVIDAILTALEAQGISPALFHTEYGPGQQELSVQPADALRAADTVCLVRETVRGVAARSDLLASFAPKPFLAHAGSGAHLHLSLWGTQSGAHPGQNLFSAAGEPGGLSTLGRHFIGGVLRHLRGLLALTCASPNSYARLQPHAWSSAYAVWGFDNREAALRVPSLYWGREEASTHLELKCADHSGNPYLALGAFLAAGLDGILHQIDPGPSLEEDPGSYSEAERLQNGIERLPKTLDDALDALEDDAVLLEALGPLLAASYLAVKRSEATFCQEHTPEQVAYEHFLKY